MTDEPQEQEFKRSDYGVLPFKFKTVAVRPFWDPSWRHPLDRWRTRHLRRLIREAAAERQELWRTNPTLAALATQVEEEEERAFLFGANASGESG